MSAYDERYETVCLETYALFLLYQDVKFGFLQSNVFVTQNLG